MAERKTFSGEDEELVRHVIRESIAHFSTAATVQAKAKNRTLNTRSPDRAHENRDRPGFTPVWSCGICGRGIYRPKNGGTTYDARTDRVHTHRYWTCSSCGTELTEEYPRTAEQIARGRLTFDEQIADIHAEPTVVVAATGAPHGCPKQRKKSKETARPRADKPRLGKRKDERCSRCGAAVFFDDARVVSPRYDAATNRLHKCPVKRRRGLSRLRDLPRDPLDDAYGGWGTGKRR